MSTPHTTLLRRQAVQMQTGLARSTLYKMISAGDFPSPVKITGKSVAWSSSSVDAWIAARIAAAGACAPAGGTTPVELEQRRARVYERRLRLHGEAVPKAVDQYASRSLAPIVKGGI